MFWVRVCRCTKNILTLFYNLLGLRLNFEMYVFFIFITLKTWPKHYFSHSNMFMCSKLDYKLLNLCTHQEYIIGSHIYVSKLVGVGLVKQVVTKYRLFNMRKPLSGS